MENQEGNENNEAENVAAVWQLRMTSALERDDYILGKQLWTDCSVTVGKHPDTEVYQCHRVYLAKSSPVLAAMLYKGKEKTPQEHISLPEIQPAAFSQVLSYIYTDSVSQLGWEGMYALATAARHLELPHLLGACLDHLRSHANVGNACILYELAQTAGNSSLEQHCFKIMCDNAARILEEPSIEHINLTTLVSLLSQDGLHVASDIPLIEASVRWARCQVQQRGITETPLSLREALGPAFGLLRFLSLTPSQFAAYPSKSELLTLEECLSILTNLSSPGLADLPTNFCKTMETRGGYLFGHGRVFLCQTSMDKVFFNAGQPKWCAFAFEFEVNYDLILLGAQIPSQVVVPKIGNNSDESSMLTSGSDEEVNSTEETNGDGGPCDTSEGGTYQEDLDITFEKPKPRSRAAMHFVSQVRYNSLISMKFDKPFLILKGEKYKMYVHLRKKGWYPTGTSAGNMKPLGAELNFVVNKENFFHSLIFTR